MFGSQALETGIGLALMMFILAVATSNLLDLGRRLLNLRSKDLEVALMSFFDGTPDPGPKRIGKGISRLVGAVGGPALQGKEVEAWAKFADTSVYRGAAAARQQVRPAYLSAKAFADAVDELLADDVELTGPLKKRVDALSGSVAGRSAQLEAWFDEAMSGLTSRYKKKSTMWLFFFGSVLALGLNASFPHVAGDLWQDSVTRASVVAAAQNYVPASTPTSSAADEIEQVAGAADSLKEVGLPIGWSTAPDAAGRTQTWWLTHVLGWLMTGLLASLGGPFWFDIFGRLTAARAGKPSTSGADLTVAVAPGPEQ